MNRREWLRGVVASTLVRFAPIGFVAAGATERLVSRFQGVSGRTYELYLHASRAPSGALWQGYYLTRTNGQAMVIARVNQLRQVEWTREEWLISGRDSVEMARALSPKAKSAWLTVTEFGSWAVRLIPS